MSSLVDVAVVGSGPNGLAAAVTMARAGLAVQVFEASTTLGGGVRTLEMTEPGHWHDWGSAVHPMALASPFFREFAITERVRFMTPEVSYGQPLDGGRAAIAWRDLERTAEGLGRDGAAWLRMFAPLVRNLDELVEFAMSPMLPIPRRLTAGVAYGLRVLEQGSALHRLRFEDDLAPALLSGAFAHSIGTIPGLGTAAAGTMLAALGHGGGWPIPDGGSQAITNALIDDLGAHGGTITTGHLVASMDDLPPARAIIFDTSPRTLVGIAGDHLTPRYRRALSRFRYGNAASKVDFALSGPVPWANDDLRLTGTVHVGGTYGEVAAAEREVAHGTHPTRPYVLVAQPSLFDASRAPQGRHTLWAYAHVPAGSTLDMTEPITAQIERFAPGFRDLVVASTATPADRLEEGNPNLVGGDIAAGAADFRQLLARPVFSRAPWRAGVGMYLCSASTAPGPGVHAMAGHHAARLALKEIFGLEAPSLAPDGHPVDRRD